MTLDEIVLEWSKDARIDPTDLFNESLVRGQLHAKYIKFLITEKKLLITLRKDLKVLRKDKKDFISNPSKEFLDKGWKLPAEGRITHKASKEEYVSADPDVIDLELKIAVQEEKEDLIKSILTEIKARGYDIKNALTDKQFLSGG